MDFFYDDDLIENAGIYFWETDLFTKNVKFSKSFYFITGYSPDELESYSDVLCTLSEEDYKRLSNFIKNSITHGLEFINTEYSVIDKKGHNIRMSGSIRIIKNDVNIVIRGMGRTISPAQTTIPYNENESILSVVFSPDDLSIIEVNKNFASSLGYSVTELKDKYLSSFTRITNRFIEELSKKTDNFSVTEESSLNMIHKSGREFEIKVKFEKVDDNENCFLKLTSTEPRKKLISEEYPEYIEILQNSPSSVVIVNRQGIIEYVNPRFTDITGYEYNEIIGQNPRKLKSGYQSEEFYQDLWTTLLTKGHWSGEFNNLRKDGTAFWESSIITSMRDDKGNIVRFIKFGEDITEKKHSQILQNLEAGITSRIYYPGNSSEKLQLILEIFLKAVELQYGAIFTSYSEGKYNIKAAVGIPDEYKNSGNKIIDYDKLPAILNKNEIIYDQTENLFPGFATLSNGISLKSFALIPVNYQGKSVGFFLLGSHCSWKINSYVKEIIEKSAVFIRQSVIIVKEQEEINRATLDVSLAFRSVKACAWVYNLNKDDFVPKEIPSWTAMLGYTENDFSKLDIAAWQELVHPEDRESCKEVFIDSCDKNYGNTIDYRIRHKNGKWVWVSATWHIAGNEKDSTPSEIHGILLEISKIKENELKLKEAQTIAKIGNWEYDILNDRLEWSDEIYNILERVRNDSVIKIADFYNYVHPEDKELVNSTYAAAVESRLPYDLVHRLLFSNGKVKYVRQRGFTEYNREGIPVKSFGVMLDITDLENSKRKLAESEENYRLIAENTSDGLLVMETNEISFISPSLKRIMGYSEHNRPKTIEDFFARIHPDDRNTIKDKFYSAIAKRVPEIIYSFRILHCEGSYIWREDSAKFIYDQRGVYKRVHIIARDITPQKISEKKLIEADREKSAILDAIPDSMFLINDKGIFESCHSSTEYDYIKPENFINKSIKEALEPELAKVTSENVRNVLNNGESVIFQFDMSYHGEPRHLECRIIYLDQRRVMAMVRDITENVNLTAELIKAKEKAEKSELIKSEFLAQMSHEIRTPVGAIMNYSQILREFVDKNQHETSSVFEGIERSGKRIIRTINLILNSSELETGMYDYHPVKINLKDDVFNGLQSEFSYLAELKKLNFTINIPADIDIYADEYSVIQIFGNLLDNAFKFTDYGFISVESKIINDNFVEIAVIDTGIGISESYIPELFRAFTQEETGYSRKFEGTGLGLKLVSEYCKLNSAKIRVESKKGSGSKFIVTFRINR